MTIKKNIDQVYFNSFVGIWKKASLKGSPTNGYIKFNSDCTFEDDGSFGIHEGTVNGDVDEISVDDDGSGNDGNGTNSRKLKGKRIIRDLIKGKAILTKDTRRQEWSFRLGKGRVLGIKNDNPVLELSNNEGRLIYVGNLPLVEGQPTNNSKKRAKV